jgi:hypothetical protein
MLYNVTLLRRLRRGKISRQILHLVLEGKPVMHRFGLLIVAALFLVSCGGSPAAPATTTTTSTAQASVQATAAPSPSPSAEPSSEPSAEPSSSPESSTEPSPNTGAAEGADPAVAVYATEIQDPLTNIGEGLTGFGTLFQNPQLTDDAWKAQVVTEMDKIRQGHESLTKIEPPAAAEPTHEQLIDATSDCNEATNKITSGLDNSNVNEIGEAATLIVSCGTKLQTAQEMLLELAPQ